MPVALPAFDYPYWDDPATRAPTAAEVRTATDLVKDPYGRLLDFIAKAQIKQAPPSATSAPSDSAPKITSLSGMSPWLLDTVRIIDAYRRYLNGTAGDTLIARSLDTAEMLASFLADIPPRHRPQLNIDSDGRPSFATVLDDFYIHLTVDEPNQLTWYAVVRGAEHFDEGVAFNGRKLPADLKQLFSL
jgi:hypothetical protein